MPNPNYLKGRRFEHTLVKELKEQGCIAFRSAGSHSAYDVVAINPANGHIKFIQAKVTEKESEATRLLSDFRDDPPVPPFLMPPKVAQILAVKVARKGRREVTV
jgi:hypothetical protein